MATNGFESLGSTISRYGAITFPDTVEMFHIDANGTATRVAQNIVTMSRTHPVVIRHRPHMVEIWTSQPIERAFRIVVINYRVRPYDRSVIGYIRFERMLGVIRVSDYAMSLAAGELPAIFREDTVYILGVRLEQQTRAEVAITDAENITYLEELIFDQTRLYAANHRINMRQSGSHYHQALRQNHPAFLPQNPLRAIVPLSAATPALLTSRDEDNDNTVAIRRQAAYIEEMGRNEESDEIGNVSMASSVPHRCMICFTRTADHRMNPCNHVMCMACSHRIMEEDSAFNRCPFCRMVITNVVYDATV